MTARQIMISAGGTGGHVFPALALAEELRARGHEIQWLGTDRGIEARLVPAAGFVLHYLPVQGLRGRGLIPLLKAPGQLFTAVQAVRKLFRAQRPDLVVGLGGYAAGPGGLAAWLMRIPLVIHEQNARPGTTNKILARLAQKVLTAFPRVLPHGQYIGNPVRTDISQLPGPATRFVGRDGAPRLLVLGGSLGAKAINDLVPEALAMLPAEKRPEVYHQAGANHWEAVQQDYAARTLDGRVEPFIDNMAEALGWADLVICRAGALTVAELAAVGVASILVPFPYAIDDHQTANARWLSQAGAAHLRPQSDLTAKGLKDLMQSLFEDRTQLVAMATAARGLARPQATSEFADICLEVARG